MRHQLLGNLFWFRLSLFSLPLEFALGHMLLGGFATNFHETASWKVLSVTSLVFVMALVFWSISIGYAYQVAAMHYGFKRGSLLPGMPPYWKLSNNILLMTLIASYLQFLYGFAIIYFLISHINPHAFSIGSLDRLSAYYFSLVTATTTGYGDIAPQSGLARSLAMVEIFIGLIYAFFLFSIASVFLRERK